jgi:hypothetical protein
VVLVYVRWSSTLTGPSRPVVLRFFRPGALVYASSPEPCPSQQEASFSLDSSLLSSLISSAPSPLDRQRLNRVSQPHAGAWVTAVPSSVDGPDALIRPRAFRVACRLRLGIPVWHEGASCPCCTHTLDIFGVHALCCTTSGDLIARHNRIRDLVDKIAREGHLGPVLEKKGILGEISGRRPGDVTIPLWCEGKGLAIDVAVTCPFSSSNMARDNPTEYYAEKLKHRKYDAGFVGVNFDFSALVFESTGGVNREGREVLSQLFRFAARFSGSPFCVYAGRAWARLSCTLQAAVAQSILNRFPGVPMEPLGSLSPPPIPSFQLSGSAFPSPTGFSAPVSRAIFENPADPLDALLAVWDGKGTGSDSPPLADVHSPSLVKKMNILRKPKFWMETFPCVSDEFEARKPSEAIRLRGFSGLKFT